MKIIRLNKEKNYYTPTQLKNLVQAAQRYEQHAIDKLCEDFKPLIYKEARQANVYAALGEDAINIAWEIFLSFIYKYKGNNFRLLPGLVQKHVHYELLHKITRQQSITDCASLDADNNIEIAAKDDIANWEHSLFITNALTKLTIKQQSIVQEIILQDNSYIAYCNKYKCSQKTAFKHRAKAIKKLKELLQA